MMPDILHTFDTSLNGIAFNVRVFGSAPAYRFIVRASCEGMTLFTQHVIKPFTWFAAKGTTLEETALAVFDKDYAPRLYNLAANTARRIKAELAIQDNNR